MGHAFFLLCSQDLCAVKQLIIRCIGNINKCIERNGIDNGCWACCGLHSDGYVLLIPCICGLLGKWESVCFRWVKCCPRCFPVRNPGLWEALSAVGPLEQVRLPVTPHCPSSHSSDTGSTFRQHSCALAFPRDGGGSPGHGGLVPADGKPCSSWWE